jgi:hypothetical protein
VLLAGAAIALAAAPAAWAPPPPPPVLIVHYAAPNGDPSASNDCTHDNAPCSLQRAITAATDAASTSVAVRLEGGDYTLGSSGIAVNKAMTVFGLPGQPRPRISADVGFVLRATVPGVTLRYLEFVGGASGLLMQGNGTGSTSTAEQLVVHANQFACDLHDIAATVKDTVCRSETDRAVRVVTNHADASLSARNVTAISGSNTALEADTDRFGGGCGDCNVSLVAVNTIARGGAHDVLASNTSTGTDKISLSYSNYDPSKVVASDPGTTVTDGGHNQSAAPIFACASAGDYHQAMGSPTIDAGLTDDANNGSHDLDDDARTLNGTTDIGADELVPPGQPACGSIPGGPNQIQPGGTQEPGGTQLRDEVPPLLAAASLTNTVFAVDSRGPSETLVAARKAKKGTTFSYTLSEPARVVFTIRRRARGRKVGHKCRKPTHKNRGKRRCTRYKLSGRFAQQSVVGRNATRWSGKIGNKSLKPGRYRAALVATDAAGNHSLPRTVRFRVVRR